MCNVILDLIEKGMFCSSRGRGRMLVQQWRRRDRKKHLLLRNEIFYL